MFIGLSFKLLQGVSALPPSAGYVIGHALGILIRLCFPKRRYVCETNIRLCFPELSADEQHKLVQECFLNIGIGIIECGWAWFREATFIERRLNIEGLEVITAAREANKGILLIGPHFTIADLMAMMVFQAIGPLVITYRPQDNQVLDDIICSKRERYGRLVDVRDLRAVRRCLQNRETVWFSPDQDLGAKGSVFASFFGQPACTITTPARLAQSDSVAAIFVSARRNGEMYQLSFEPFSEQFPSVDQTANARELNALIESSISKAPSQYLWIHKRFKTRPSSSTTSIYPDY